VPLHDVRCHACGLEEEIFHKPSEPVPDCSRCHAPIEVLISMTGTPSSESTFFQGLPTLREQFQDEKILNYYVSEARKQGYNPQADDYYCSQLAKRSGDPAAFLKMGSARDQIKKVCKRRGWQCDGAVKVKKGMDRSEPPIPLADDLVQEMATKYIADGARADTPEQRAELRQKIIDNHGPPR
jgi:hypothetical protein